MITEDSLIENKKKTDEQRPYKIDGSSVLTINDIIAVSKHELKVVLDERLREKLTLSQQIIADALKRKEIIYGVNTNFGGMATHLLNENEYHSLQQNLLHGLKCGVGKQLSRTQVRATMLIRIQSLAHGVSGVSYELLHRLCVFLNKGLTPVVYEHGSIGASGDLIPLAYIAGAITGSHPSFEVEHNGKTISSHEALLLADLPPYILQPKEGLALINGTAAMTGIAAENCYISKKIMDVVLIIQAFYMQAMRSNEQPLDAFIHQCKPFKGQQYIAKQLRDLLKGSRMITPAHEPINSSSTIVQQRYGIRCYPQYAGAVFDSLEQINTWIETEANSVTDNPLVDVDNGRILSGGNFMGQYVALGMDHLRINISLLAKHLDVQIAQIMTPEFSNGLTPSLISPNGDGAQFGLKGLQICANSIVPILIRQAQPITPLYPTHAEQYNQNISSQGFSAALQSAEAVELMKKFLAINVLVALQAVDIRCYLECHHFDSRKILSAETRGFYQHMHELLEKPFSAQAAFIQQDDLVNTDAYINRLSNHFFNWTSH